MEWAHLMNLGRDDTAYKEIEGWLRAFEQNPKKWTKYYGFNVTFGRYEDIYGELRHY